MSTPVSQEVFLKAIARSFGLSIELSPTSVLSKILPVDAIGLFRLSSLLQEILPEATNLDFDKIDVSRSLNDLYLLYLELYNSQEPREFGNAPHTSSEENKATQLTEIRPLIPSDLPYVYELLLNDDLAWTWHYNTGAIPPYEIFVKTFYGAALYYLVITLTGNDRPVGVVAMYNADLRNRHGYIATAFADGLHGSMASIEAMEMCLEYTFYKWDLAKVYMQVPEFRFENYRTGEDIYFSVEGRLGSHYYLDGRRWDMLIISVYREVVIKTGKRRSVGSSN